MGDDEIEELLFTIAHSPRLVFVSCMVVAKNMNQPVYNEGKKPFIKRD